MKKCFVIVPLCMTNFGKKHCTTTLWGNKAWMNNSPIIVKLHAHPECQQDIEAFSNTFDRVQFVEAFLLKNLFSGHFCNLNFLIYLAGQMHFIKSL